MRRLNSWLLLMSLVFVQARADVVPEISPEERLSSLLAGISALHASFEQSSRGQDPQSGEIWLSKPNRFRLETRAPLSQTIVSDGDSLWTYDRDLEQVIISSLGNRLGEIPILLLAGDAEALVGDYEVDFFEDETQQYFLLQPLDEQGILGRLSITFEEGLPVAVGVDTSTQQRTLIDLNVLQSSQISEDHFQFSLPDGVDVIDDRVE